MLVNGQSPWVSDGELVDAGVPSLGVCSLWSSSFGVDVADGQVQQLERCSFVGEVPSVSGDFAELVVDRLDHVRIGYEICGVSGACSFGR